MRARKLDGPTGRPVRTVEPTGRHASDRRPARSGVNVADVTARQGRMVGNPGPAMRDCPECGRRFQQSKRPRARTCSPGCAQVRSRRNFAGRDGRK